MQAIDKVQERILIAAAELFLQRGFRSVSMDDLASSIGVSKKTIYKIFDSKSNLISILVNAHVKNDRDVILSIIDKANDPIHEMTEIGRFLYAHFKEMSPGIILELKKFYYDIWFKIDQMQNDFTLKGITANIEKGIELGLYRKDIKATFCAKVYVESIKFSCETLSHEPGIEDYYVMLLNYHMNGIMTSKGRSLFKKYTTQLGHRD